MSRSVRLTPKMRNWRKRPSPSQTTPVQGLSPEEMATTVERMELFDALIPQEAELVREYGMALGLHAARQFYGRWDEARAYCEAERLRLQSTRWGNI